MCHLGRSYCLALPVFLCSDYLACVFRITLLSRRLASVCPCLDYCCVPGLSLFVLPPGLRSPPIDPIYSLTTLVSCPRYTGLPLFDPLPFLWPRLGIKHAYGSACLSSLLPHNSDHTSGWVNNSVIYSQRFFQNESMFWMNWLKELINDSLVSTLICCHLLA